MINFMSFSLWTFVCEKTKPANKSKITPIILKTKIFSTSNNSAIFSGNIASSIPENAEKMELAVRVFFSRFMLILVFDIPLA